MEKEMSDLPNGKEKSLFEKGVNRSKFKSELKKMPYDQVKLHKKERLDIEKEMERKKYGDIIDIKDLNKYIKKLKKQVSLAPSYQERLDAKHKQDLLRKLKEKKI